MLFGVIIDSAVCLLCIVLGLLIWKKQKITLLHDYHCKNVKKEDIPAYCRQMGTGLIVIGAGIFMSGILNLIYSSLWWVPMAAGIIAGVIVMHIAQKKYNGSWFS